NETQVPPWYFGPDRLGEGRHRHLPQRARSWPAPSTPCPPPGWRVPPLPPPGESPTHAVAGPSGLAVRAACGAEGGGRRRHESGPHETAPGGGGGRAVPALGAHPPRWRLRPQLHRHTSGRAPAAHGLSWPRLPALGRWHRSGLVAGPAALHAPRESAPPPASPAHRCTRPPLAGGRLAHANGGPL